MEFEVEITFKTPHFSSIQSVKGDGLYEAFGKLNEKFEELMEGCPHINKFYIHDFKINLIRKVS